MTQRSRTGSTWALVLGGVLAAFLTLPGTVAGRDPVGLAAVPGESAADLAAALAADGTFHGRSGVAGSVDANTWTLVSDLAVGEPPRFAPAGVAAVTPIGPWFALGSDGAGNGALASTVDAIAVLGTDLYVGGGFTNAAGIPTADFIARWNGSTWSALGSNGAGNGALNGLVQALVVSGNDLYVGGNFANAR